MTTSMLLQDAQRESPGSVPATVDDLSELLRTFTAVSRQLQATQSALHGEVARLKSELAEANAQLRRSRSLAALGEMAAGIAHEIRNPLGSIQLYAQALGEEVSELPAAGSLCAKISRAVGHLDAVVRDVLSFARDMKLQPRPVDAARLIDRALETCGAMLCAHDIEVKDHHAGDAGALLADETLLVQALGNLVRNAVEAMIESGSAHRILTMSARIEPRRCPDHATRARMVFVVQDSGPGIPPDVIDRMFNPFFTTRQAGTGLGLAIVHRIIDAHGGHITVGAGDGGIGARIELCLPPDGPADATSTSSVRKEPRGDASLDRQSIVHCRVHTQSHVHHQAGMALAASPGSFMHEPDTRRR